MSTFYVGQKVRASNLQALVTPGWTSYTPVWTGSGTNPVIGNGTISGRYRRVGDADELTVEIRVVMGGSTTYGTGFWIFSLPFNASSTSTNNGIGVSYFFDTGTLTRTGGCRFNSSTQLIMDHPTLGVVGATVPHTWASTDVLIVRMTYEPA